jgi:putative membrane protein insertion efficiency factor
MSRSKKVVFGSLLALGVYLGGEALLPPSYQPSASLSVALLQAYQATGSRAMEACGVQCRYRPSCSHYAVDAISYYGTLGGVLRTAGRLWRCSPWGGSGYDPAVEPHASAYLSPQQETPEEKKQREELEKKAREAGEQLRKDWEKIQKDMPKEAGKAAGACVGGCVFSMLLLAGHIAIVVVLMFFVWKDAKARGDSNAVLWLVLIFFLSWIGAVVYFVARPKGDLSPCGSCHQKRLSTLAKCPHCGADSAAPPPPKPPSA